VVWTSRDRAPLTSGALATAGGVVFSGSLDRWFKAYDDANGRLLWQMRLNDVPSSAPISYMANGPQFVAMVIGNGGAQSATFPVLVRKSRIFRTGIPSAVTESPNSTGSQVFFAQDVDMMRLVTGDLERDAANRNVITVSRSSPQPGFLRQPAQ